MKSYVLLEKLVRSQIAEEQGVSNNPSKEELIEVKGVATRLNIIRIIVGGRMDIVRGFVGNDLGRIIGEPKDSLHRKGLAADVKSSVPKMREMFYMLSNEEVKKIFGVVELRLHATHLHIGFSPL